MPQSPETPTDSWVPSQKDAINLATLRYYALQIESLIILAYRSDPDPRRPQLPALRALLVRHMRELRELGTPRPTALRNGDCPDPDDMRCTDGYCYPPPGCPS
jgi:hypothetical protein